MKMRNTRIAIGGLMRCCIETIDKYVEAHLDDSVPKDNLIIDCMYEKPGNEKIVLEKNIWRWNRPEDLFNGTENRQAV